MDWKVQSDDLTSLFDRKKQVLNISLSLSLLFNLFFPSFRWLTNSGIENNENAKRWWTFRHIEYNPIIQNEWPDKLKNQLHSALEICWWPGLRLGNWHEYQKALISYIASGSSAHILLGGTIRDKIPEELVTIDIESYCHLYIYEYVEPLNSHEQPVFIFGYNSPFADVSFKQYQRWVMGNQYLNESFLSLAVL